MDDLLTSDSDDEKIVFKKVKQPKEKSTPKNPEMLGEISLLTSDEDQEIPNTKVKKRRPARQAAKKVTTVDLLTSDEDESPSQKVRKKQKRKLSSDWEASREASDTSPPKKQKKNTIKKPVLKKKTPAKRGAKASPQSKKAAKKVTPKKTTPIKSGKGTLRLSDGGTSITVTPSWKEFELLAERTLIEQQIAQNFIKLLEDGNTIPFIARYRKNAIGDLTPEQLRIAKENYDEICTIKARMSTVATAISKLEKLDEKLQGSICNARTMEELEHFYAPFKQAGTRTLAEKARQLGLEEAALHLLNNTSMINPVDFVNENEKDLATVENVEKGIVHIIAVEIATDSEVLAFIRELRSQTKFVLISKRARQTKDKEKSIKEAKAKKGLPVKDPKSEELKFEGYFDYSINVEYLKPHQILAINRGEALKFLTVKIEFPEYFERKFKAFCFNKWTKMSFKDYYRKNILDKAIEDAYLRWIGNLVSKEIRAELKQKAEKESCRVFSENLKHLLLASPLKGKAILGIDPGYSNGCKLALISETGTLLAHDVCYPHNNRNQNRGENIIKNMLVEHRCELIAIGNGTACRQTEEWISGLIKEGYFGDLFVQYTIVSEEGASIYSCSPEAQKEFGKLDPNIISAVSLARRIQDPLAELVKVEPSHLGIGMYQLDLKKKQLEEALNEVVSECVSFVGVDLNTASQCLLRRVAGLSDKRATQIINHREKNGPFTHRRQLVEVFGIGERVFEQCAGFLRVGPTNPHDKNFYKKKSTTPLDATIIHPESYPVVRDILVKMKLKECDIGTVPFISTFKEKLPTLNPETLATSSKTNKETVLLIFDALQKRLNHDLRFEISKRPLFKREVTTLAELEEGMILTGRVQNVTSFGAFVDVGVGQHGLLHVSKMNDIVVHLGDQIEVEVLSIDLLKKRINFQAVRKLN